MNPSAGSEDGRAEYEVRLRPIGSFDPSRNIWEMDADLSENFLAIDKIEGVLKVELQDALFKQVKQIFCLRMVTILNQLPPINPARIS